MSNRTASRLSLTSSKIWSLMHGSMQCHLLVLEIQRERLVLRTVTSGALGVQEGELRVGGVAYSNNSNLVSISPNSTLYWSWLSTQDLVMLHKAPTPLCLPHSRKLWRKKTLVNLQGFVATCEIFLCVKLCVWGGGEGKAWCLLAVTPVSKFSPQKSYFRESFFPSKVFCYTIPSVYLTLPNITVCDNSNSLERG